MNLITILGALAVLAGIAILVWPVLLNAIIALALIVMGAIAIYVGLYRSPGGMLFR